MVSFFATSTVVSCAQRKRKKICTTRNSLSVKISSGNLSNYTQGKWDCLSECLLSKLDTLQKRVVRKDTVRFKPPSQRKCHIYFGYNNSHLRFRGFRKNKWMTFVVLSGWGFEANSDEL